MAHSQFECSGRTLERFDSFSDITLVAMLSISGGGGGGICTLSLLIFPFQSGWSKAVPAQREKYTI